jgi:hypothetical protein
MKTIDKYPVRITLIKVPAWSKFRVGDNVRLTRKEANILKKAGHQFIEADKKKIIPAVIAKLLALLIGLACCEAMGQISIQVVQSPVTTTNYIPYFPPTHGNGLADHWETPWSTQFNSFDEGIWITNVIIKPNYTGTIQVGSNFYTVKDLIQKHDESWTNIEVSYGDRFWRPLPTDGIITLDDKDLLPIKLRLRGNKTTYQQWERDYTNFQVMIAYTNRSINHLEK